MRYLGLDLGTKTLGLSISDPANIFSMPLVTLHFPSNNPKMCINDLKKIVDEKNITDFVLGLPKNMDNSLGFASERSREFAKILKESFSLPIHFVDERLSTMEAEKILISTNNRRNKRKKVIDNVASAVILDTFLKERRNRDERERKE